MRSDDAGQLMLLAGIVITIAFLLTSMTLSQVASLERQAAAEKPAPIAGEWRFLHERVATNLVAAVPADLRLDPFKTVTFPTISATFRNIEAEKGYDAVLRLADSSTKFNKSELDLTYVDGGGVRRYDAWSADGAYRFTGVYDGESDGVIHYSTCPDTEHVGSCIAGVLVFMHITDGAATLSEVVLFAVNVPDA